VDAERSGADPERADAERAGAGPDFGL